MSGSRNPVELVPFDQQWAAAYAAIQRKLCDMLTCRIVSIDHIGSTSIEGMIAKPVIDVDVVLGGLDDIPVASAILVAADYEARGNRYDDAMWAFMKRGQNPHERIYLCAPGNETHRKRLAFRDCLRRYPNIARDYAQLKSRLAVIHRDNGDEYTAAKRPFIDNVLRQVMTGA